MWPFSKKHRDLSELPSTEDEQWGVAKAEYGGSPLIVRYNTTAKEWVGHPKLPIKLGFAIPLNSPKEGGLPDTTENQQLNDIEDVICQEVARRATGLLAVALTLGTMKEIVFYIAPGADINAIHESIKAQVKTHEIQCIAEMEPRWDSYSRFAPDE